MFAGSIAIALPVRVTTVPVTTSRASKARAADSTSTDAASTDAGVGVAARSDEDLMRAYVEGDRPAFRALFQRLAPRLHAFFLRYFRSKAVADDLLQTTFLKLHRARASYDTDAKLLPWVYTIASRVRLDELRRRYRVPKTSSDDGRVEATVAFDAPDAPSRIEAGERAERVRQAVDALPEGQRIVIHLNRFEGLTFAEVAEVLEMNEGAVRVRAFRAYERLRASLGDLIAPDDQDDVDAARRDGADADADGGAP